MKNIFRWVTGHKIITTVIIVVIIIFAVADGGSSKSTNNIQPGSSSEPKIQGQTESEPPVSKTAKRQVTGSATTLGAGTFVGGTDIDVGLYDVTPGSNQSGNFIVIGTDTYDEILGDNGIDGVTKVRAQISKGDKIEISSLSSVTFTPVTTAFVTTHTTATIYAGTFIVGQDVGAGRYVVTPGDGESGNFIVSGKDSYDEILGGDTSLGEVPKVSSTLSRGDIIDISGMNEVTLTAE